MGQRLDSEHCIIISPYLVCIWKQLLLNSPIFKRFQSSRSLKMQIARGSNDIKMSRHLLIVPLHKEMHFVHYLRIFCLCQRSKRCLFPRRCSACKGQIWRLHQEEFSRRLVRSRLSSASACLKMEESVTRVLK